MEREREGGKGRREKGWERGREGGTKGEVERQTDRERERERESGRESGREKEIDPEVVVPEEDQTSPLLAICRTRKQHLTERKVLLLNSDLLDAY